MLRGSVGGHEKGRGDGSVLRSAQRFGEHVGPLLRARDKGRAEDTAGNTIAQLVSMAQDVLR